MRLFVAALLFVTFSVAAAAPQWPDAFAMALSGNTGPPVNGVVTAILVFDTAQAAFSVDEVIVSASTNQTLSAVALGGANGPTCALTIPGLVPGNCVVACNHSVPCAFLGPTGCASCVVPDLNQLFNSNPTQCAGGSLYTTTATTAGVVAKIGLCWGNNNQPLYISIDVPNSSGTLTVNKYSVGPQAPIAAPKSCGCPTTKQRHSLSATAPLAQHSLLGALFGLKL